MKKSLLIALSSLVVLAGCGPTKTETKVVSTWTNMVNSSASLSSWSVVVSNTTDTLTWTETTITISWNVSSLANMSSLANVSSQVSLNANTSTANWSANISESLAIINNTKFSEANCQKIADFMACSIKSITWDAQVLAASQMATQLKEMVADTARGPKCDSQYNMLKSSPELASFEQQVNCKLQ